MRFPSACAVAVLLAVPFGCNQQEPDEKWQTTIEIDPTDSTTPAGPPPPSLSSHHARLPAADEARLIVLSDKRCTDRQCNPDPVLTKLRSMLAGLKVVRYDWSEEECQTIFEREGLKTLPAYLLDEAVKTNPGYAKIRTYLEQTPKGKLRQVQVRTDFDPRAEICDNGKDDTGNGQVDCEDRSCKTKVVCRKEIPGRLDLFVMSQCPYGVKAVDSMADVLDAFERKIDFHVHFIANEKGDGFRSLHGQAEVDENIRQLCAIEHFPKNYTYLEYLWCRNRKVKDPNWQACTGKKGIDTGALAKCFGGEEGPALLRDDIKLANELGIGGSPTWLANNRFIFSGIAPEAIKQGFCQHNEGTKGCEKKLSSKSPVPDGVCN